MFPDLITPDHAYQVNAAAGANDSLNYGEVRATRSRHPDGPSASPAQATRGTVDRVIAL